MTDDRKTSFNPSQVGYKLCKARRRCKSRSCFNPSQVGYKHNLTVCVPHRASVSIPHR